MKKKLFPILVTLSLSLSMVACSNSTPNLTAPSPTKPPTPAQKIEEPKPVTTSVRMAAIGDVLIHSSLYRDAKTANGYDFRYQFELVKPYLNQADLAIANQETMIGGVELGLADYPMFNSPYEVGDALKDTGIDVVSIANNHSLDAGEQGIRNAIKHWNDIGMVYVGANHSQEDQDRIRTIERNGITFSVLSYTYGTNGLQVPEGKSYLVNYIDPVRIKQDVAKAKKASDVVILNLHTGGEYQRMPNDEQKQLFQEMANAGVDVILGHHPHVLQPVQWLNRADGGKTFVVYSLGNFISGQDEIYREIGGILELTIEKTTTGDKKIIALKDPAFLPVWTHKKNWRQYKVIPLEKVQPNQLPQAKTLYEEINAHMKQWVPELKATL